MTPTYPKGPHSEFRHEVFAWCYDHHVLPSELATWIAMRDLAYTWAVHTFFRTGRTPHARYGHHSLFSIRSDADYIAAVRKAFEAVKAEYKQAEEC